MGVLAGIYQFWCDHDQNSPKGGSEVFASLLGRRMFSQGNETGQERGGKRSSVTEWGERHTALDLIS